MVKNLGSGGRNAPALARCCSHIVLAKEMEEKKEKASAIRYSDASANIGRRGRLVQKLRRGRVYHHPFISRREEGRSSTSRSMISGFL